jgi:hypothetical protein
MVLNHILEHVEMLRTTDPGLLSILQEQPLGPVNGTPPNLENMIANPNMSAVPEGGVVDPNIMRPGQPQMPNMPELPEGAMQVNSPIPQE